MSRYTTVLFDLDHTLWDYEYNSRATLSELYKEYQLEDVGIANEEIFINQFEKVNHNMWDRYNHGEVDRAYIKTFRFSAILENFSISNQELGLQLSTDYIAACPKKGKLLPYAVETLQYLYTKYKLAVITNGFEDVQHIKLQHAGIKDFFTEVITSDKTGFRKPSREIFNYALNSLSCNNEQALMIGDNLITDIAGARKALIDTAFYNPQQIKHQQEVSYEISCLSELKNII